MSDAATQTERDTEGKPPVLTLRKDATFHERQKDALAKIGQLKRSRAETPPDNPLAAPAPSSDSQTKNQGDDQDQGDAPGDQDDQDLLADNADEEGAGEEGQDQEGQDETDGETEKSAEPSPDTKIKVKVSGKEQEITYAQLKQSYASQGELSRLVNQVLDKQKSLDGEATKMKDGLEWLGSVTEALLGEPPPESLRADDETEYLRRKDQYQQRKALVDSIREKQSELGKKSEEQTANEQRAYAQEQYSRLLTEMPEFEQVKSDLLQYAMESGAPEENIRGVHPWYIYVWADKARKYDRLQAEKPGLKKRVKDAPNRNMRPGSTSPRSNDREKQALKDVIYDKTGKYRPQQKQHALRQLRQVERQEREQQRR